jgi:hypothetical protein
MKKQTLTVLATSLAISLFAQGTVHFDNNVPGYPAPVSGPTGLPLAGSNFSAQLIGAPGYNVAESSLLPASPPTSFQTAFAGFVVPTTSTFMNILPDAPQATIEMVAWDNSSGLYPTWSQASLGWLNGLIAAGMSGTWNQDKIGGNVNFPPNMINSTDPTQRVHSFNIQFIPEPTTAALAGLGATALLISRRRK